MTTTIEQPAVPAVAFRPEAITYPVLEAQIAKWREQGMALTIAGVDDKDGIAKVHEARLTVKRARVEIEKRRKELKAGALAYGNKVDHAARTLTELIAPIEAHLEAEEDRIAAEKERIKRAAEEAQWKLVQERLLLLAISRAVETIRNLAQN